MKKISIIIDGKQMDLTLGEPITILVGREGNANQGVGYLKQSDGNQMPIYIKDAATCVGERIAVILTRVVIHENGRISCDAEIVRG
jgi:uncharacterized protein YacL